MINVSNSLNKDKLFYKVPEAIINTSSKLFFSIPFCQELTVKPLRVNTVN